jgi:hypothetical protein
MILVQEARGA